MNPRSKLMNEINSDVPGSDTLAVTISKIPKAPGESVQSLGKDLYHPPCSDQGGLIQHHILAETIHLFVLI